MNGILAEFAPGRKAGGEDAGHGRRSHRQDYRRGTGRSDDAAERLDLPGDRAVIFDWTAKRNKIVSEEMNFPSNLYIYQQQGARLATVPSDDRIGVPTDRMLAAIDWNAGAGATESSSMERRLTGPVLAVEGQVRYGHRRCTRESPMRFSNRSGQADGGLSRKRIWGWDCGDYSRISELAGLLMIRSRRREGLPGGVYPRSPLDRRRGSFTDLRQGDRRGPRNGSHPQPRGEDNWSGPRQSLPLRAAQRDAGPRDVGPGGAPADLR